MSDQKSTVIKKINVNNSSAPAGAVYGLGMIGAAIYYFQQADNFWMVVVGFVKALVWPAIFVYKFLESLA